MVNSVRKRGRKVKSVKEPDHELKEEIEGKNTGKISSILNNFTIIIAIIFISISYYYISLKFVKYEFIDEIFHIRQAQEYCSGNFQKWNPKITTPPGLYYIAWAFQSFLTTLLPGFEIPCSIEILRLVNVLGGTIVLPALIIYPIYVTFPQKLWIGNIMLFPLITIYFNLFYTDIWSSILILTSFNISYLWDIDHLASFIGANFGLASLFLRQTNIVWNGFNLVILMDRKIGVYRLKEFKSEYFRVLNYFKYLQVFEWFYKLIINIGIFLESSYNNLSLVVPYALNFILFGLFVVFNEGITFGDKENHITSIHLPQIYYCLLFMGFFSWPIILSKKSIVRYVQFSFGTLTNFARTMLIYQFINWTIKNFTIVHPFLLADNRHYTFYIWRRIINYNKFSSVLLIPIYHFLGFSIINQLTIGKKKCSIIVIISFIVCTCATLIPSPLFEPRYYILPYLYWRILINVDEGKNEVSIVTRLLLEFIWNLVVNVGILYIFINYEFFWDSEPGIIQRIIW